MVVCMGIRLMDKIELIVLNERTVTANPYIEHVDHASFHFPKSTQIFILM